MRKRGLCCRPVCLSVRPSGTFVDCIHTAEDIVKLLVRPSSRIIVVFDTQRQYPIVKLIKFFLYHSIYRYQLW